jgi:uncharacterized protein
MIATIVNCITVFIGSIIGLTVHAKVRDDIRDVVYIGAGCISFVIGLQMAFLSTRVLYLVFSLFIGGILGTLWNVEGGIFRFGGFLEKMVLKRQKKGQGTDAVSAVETPVAAPGTVAEEPGIAAVEPATGDSRNFALGFLNASVLFCVGAMTIVGAMRAGAEGDYDLILMKSIMDGFMAIMFSAALGIGVMFSIITILVYQGGLTLLAGQIGPIIGELGLSEISGVGGVLVMMIGINLLGLREIKTANFLPALLVVLFFTTLEPYWLPAAKSVFGF